MDHVSKKRLTAHYVFALGVIGITTLISHYTVLKSLNENEGSAQVINTSGRQRMLSQRIASQAAQHALGVPQASAELLATTQRFVAEADALRKKVEGLNEHSSATRQLKALYEQGLAADIHRYVAQARSVAALPPSEAARSPELASLLGSAHAPLLNQLDQVVSQQQKIAEQQITGLAQLQKITLGVVLLTLLIEALAIFRPMVNRVVDYAARLLHLATTDELTKVNNRRAFMERAESEMIRARRYDKPISLLMLDVDHFKKVNDTFGHGGGDAALTTLAEHCRLSLRTTDFVGRPGGEEFAIMLPETPLEGAMMIAERLRAAIANLAASHGRQKIHFTVSIGVASFGERLESLDTLIHAADKALYAAKAGGRNQVLPFVAAE